MPTYEYECIECKSILEEFSSIKDMKQKIKCSNCGADAIRIISASCIVIHNPVSEVRRGRGKG